MTETPHDSLSSPMVAESQQNPQIGTRLRAAREASGMSVAEAAQRLKLTQRQVQAMEDDRFDILPGIAFVRGFVRNYARLLNIPHEPLLLQLGGAVEAKPGIELQPVQNAGGKMPERSESERRGFGSTLLVLVLLAVLLGLGWHFDWRLPQGLFGSEGGTPPTTMLGPQPAGDLTMPSSRTELTPQAVFPPASAIDESSAPVLLAPPSELRDLSDVVEAQETEAGGATLSAEDAAGEPAANPQNRSTEGGGAAASGLAASETGTAGDVGLGATRLEFGFSGDSWVEVRDGAGSVVISRNFSSGASYELVGTPPFSLVIGNAKDVRLTRDGSAVDLTPHIRVSVARLRLE